MTNQVFPGDVVEIDSGIMGIVHVKVMSIEGEWCRVLDDEDPDAIGEFWWPVAKMKQVIK